MDKRMEAIQQLTEELHEKNPTLTFSEARNWIELFWEDFEATRAKAGRKYEGTDVTQKIVRLWIKQYGDKLDDFVKRHPKYQALLK